MRRTQADELSRYWHDLGRVLASRKLLASLHGGPNAKLTPTRMRALDALAESGGSRVGELAEYVGIDETSATRLVDRLESLGLAERQPLAGDRRATLVKLTATGERLAATIAAQRREFFRDVLGVLEPDERDELVRLTAKAADALRSRSKELTRR